MREQILIWYTPEEKMPEPDRTLLYNANGELIIGYLVSGMEDTFVGYITIDKKHIKEWAYL